jgi:D-alanine-D-alanine ligase
MASVIVLCGGTSDEREVSLRSGASVVNALQVAGHTVSSLDPADGLEGQLESLKAADVVFPILHGLGGEDGSLQLFLEQHNITYIGADSESSRLSFYKDLANEVFNRHGLLTPDTKLDSFEDYQNDPLTTSPHVIKPNDGGSSIDTFIVRDTSHAPIDEIRTAFEKHQQMIVQTLIEGIELTVPVLGDEALPVIEIIPPTDGEFDYENKYNGKTQELCPPPSLSDEQQKQCQALALQMHQAFGCRDLSRSDMILSADGQLYAIEINTLPGMTDQSLVPRSAAVAGYDMPTLCDMLVQMALKRST